MSTATARSLRLPALLLACALLTLGCNRESNSAWIKPDPPRVSCKQKVDDSVPQAPRADEWVEATADGGVTLSEKAALLVADLLGLLTESRKAQTIANGCLDGAEAKGLIRQ